MSRDVVYRTRHLARFRRIQLRFGTNLTILSFVDLIRPEKRDTVGLLLSRAIPFPIVGTTSAVQPGKQFTDAMPAPLNAWKHIGTLLLRLIPRQVSMSRFLAMAYRRTIGVSSACNIQ